MEPPPPAPSSPGSPGAPLPARTLGLLAEAGHLGLATDLYQLTMAAAYWRHGLGREYATFELFVRKLPPGRSYLVAAGLEQAVEFLQALQFDAASLDYLCALPQFRSLPTGFREALAAFRFTGDVHAMPEGTLVFPQEPLLQVRAPLLQAQMVETFLLATLNHQTAIATKAARVVEAAAGKGVVEFGARRAHGFDAALYGARAAVIGGCIGTSNVLAGRTFGLRVFGTAAHSFTMAFAREIDAFRAYLETFPEHATLLIDTYDTLEGARRAASLGPRVQGVRLDSGDLLALSRQVRRILDDAGLAATRIVASGDLDEHAVGALEAAGAPIDLYGVGTELITSRDAPALGGVYKLVEVEEASGPRPVRKLSEGKVSWPGVKQVYRQRGAEGLLRGDVLGLRGEEVPGEPLLRPVLREGRRVGGWAAGPPPLEEARARAREQREALPPGLRRSPHEGEYPVSISPGLARLAAELPTGA